LTHIVQPPRYLGYKYTKNAFAAERAPVANAFLVYLEPGKGGTRLVAAHVFLFISVKRKVRT